MIRPKTTKLFFAPANQFVESIIVSLTPQMADEKIIEGWWDDECLKAQFDVMPIDRHWDWNEMGIEYEGRALAHEKIAIVSNEQVQGAMMISSESVPSVIDKGNPSLFVELLFTAPRNRIDLREDGKPYLKGVGIELLTWAAFFSREKGCGGRLMLDASPDFIDWYEKRGLQRIKMEVIVYEGVNYTPMELTPSKSKVLLSSWQ